MPSITLHLEALEHNIRLTRRLCRLWGCHMLPVLKMVACHPVAARLMYQAGFESVGAADVDEPDLFGPAPEGRKTLINIAPPSRADDVVRRFQRSAASSLEGLTALETAAARAGLPHDVLLMLDIGDLREGVPAPRAGDLAEAIRHRGFRHARVTGVGVNLGCLYGTCPDGENMALLRRTVNDMETTLGRPLEVISLGGSIFLDWFARQGRAPDFGPGRRVEFRAGDPLLLGYDLYRGQDFPEAGFRRDVFTLEAEVVECHERDIEPPRHSVRNGQGLRLVPECLGRRRRALLDCGRLHTVVEELTLDFPGAEIVDFSGNYAVLDITDCPAPPGIGDRVTFRPGYWAVARAFRTPAVLKRFV